MNPQTYLTVLTFVGLLVGSIGGLISQLTKTSVEVDGTMRKRLTSPGRWALAISLLGFAGSFSSEILKTSIQAQQKAQAEFDAKLKKERERQDDLWKTRSDELAGKIFDKTTSALTNSETNLKTTIEGFEKEQADTLRTRLDIADSRQKVLSDNLVHETRLYGRLSAAGTPLTTMTIRMTVDGVPSAIRQKLVKGLDEARNSTGEDWYEDLSIHHNTGPEDDINLVQSRMDEKVIQPFIDWLGADQFLPDLDWSKKEQTAQSQGILAISLDKNFSALACVGWVSEPDIFRKDVMDPPVNESLLPSGVLIGDEIEFRLSVTGRKRAYTRQKSLRPGIRLAVVKDSVVLTIELTRLSLNDSLLRYAQNAGTTAALPDDVEFFSWSPSADGKESAFGNPDVLPFDPVEVHSSIVGLDSRSGANSNNIPAPLRRLRLQIIPNGIEQISKTYDLTFAADDDIMEGSRDDENRGYVRLWHGHAR